MSVHLPKSVTAIVNEETMTNPSNIEEAVSQSKARISQLPEYAELVDRFITDAIRTYVYQVRHASNQEMKRQAGHYGKPSKVNRISTAINEVYKKSYLDTYFVNSMALGDVQGKDLDAIADTARERASGYVFQAQLMEWLRSKGVVGDKRVRDVVTSKQVEAYFKKNQRKIDSEAA
jgi:hypothetical protein